MAYKLTVLFLYLVFVAVQAIEVNLTNEWKLDQGWEVSCTWKIPTGDSLQSVRLYQNNQQFLIFRPEVNGPFDRVVYRREEDMLTTNCAIPDDDRQKGSCVITLELYQPQKDDITMSCEVSGERPYFRMERKNVVVEKFVPPTDALVTVRSNLESNRVSLNCTASGVPLPTLTWNIGEQQIPREFSGGAWNATTKLYEAWSSLSYTPSSGNTIVCTPEISKGSKIVKGHPAEFNAGTDIKGGLSNIIITVIFLILLK